jgi:hypothetical protein
MKWILKIICVLLISVSLNGKTHLINYKSHFSEVYGGMEDGGISRYEYFHFSVRASIQVKAMYFKDAPLELKKGDTLVVMVAKYIPYNRPHIISDPDGLKEKKETTTEIPDKEKFKIRWEGKTCYANYHLSGDWNETINYLHRKKEYTIKTKGSFDSGTTDYAP